MSEMQRTIVICVGMVCAMLTITVTSHNLNRQAKTPAVLFFEACAWNADALERARCAQLAGDEDRK